MSILLWHLHEPPIVLFDGVDTSTGPALRQRQSLFRTNFPPCIMKAFRSNTLKLLALFPAPVPPASPFFLMAVSSHATFHSRGWTPLDYPPAYAEPKPRTTVGRACRNCHCTVPSSSKAAEPSSGCVVGPAFHAGSLSPSCIFMVQICTHVFALVASVGSTVLSSLGLLPASSPPAVPPPSSARGREKRHPWRRCGRLETSAVSDAGYNADVLPQKCYPRK